MFDLQLRTFTYRWLVSQLMSSKTFLIGLAEYLAPLLELSGVWLGLVRVSSCLKPNDPTESYRQYLDVISSSKLPCLSVVSASNHRASAKHVRLNVYRKFTHLWLDVIYLSVETVCCSQESAKWLASRCDFCSFSCSYPPKLFFGEFG
jgi:hypothetical protein